METLYHYPLCPFSRQIRIFLKELGKELKLVKEEYWLRSKTLLKLNPAGELPVIVTADNLAICDVYSIIEYLRETSATEDFLFSVDMIARANIRRIISWFNNKFYHEVTKHMLNEKVIRLLLRAGSPNTEILQLSRKNLTSHLKYITGLLELHSNLAINRLTIADIAAASHLSVVDYFGEIEWSRYPLVKEWYMIIKSRPSFRSLLNDYVVGPVQAKHYAKLDF